MSAEIPLLRPDWAVFFDIDGTLLDFAARPDLVEVPAGLLDHLVALRGRLDGAVALVSGRALATIDRLFAPLNLPAAGQHGAELRLDRETVAIPRDPHLDAISTALQQFAAVHPGLILEDKGDSVALHYRLAQGLAAEVEELAGKLVAAAGPSLQLMSSYLAVDIKARNVTKGSAIDWFMARRPFRGRVPVFFGDDRTDEDGFVAVNAREGHSVLVGTRPDSAARFRLAAPAELRRWLARQAPGTAK